ncbi:MAG: DNA photolyase family protein, partial [Bdellovibrionales bacterium]|nr:DNA photolyase family protein [Bdellovibrionales bacterium]
MKSYGIHWFRRDLRVAGNLALKQNFKKHEGRVLGVFCFDKAFLSRDDFSVNRFQFFINSLQELQNELRELGSDLLFLDIGPQKAWPELLKQLAKAPDTISWGRDYEPFAIKRDKEMKEYFHSQSIETIALRDHLLIEPNELEKAPGEGYQVYSPFSRKWLQIFQEETIQKRVSQQVRGLEYLEKRLNGEVEKVFDLTWDELLPDNPYKENLKIYKEENGKNVNVEIPPAGSLEGYKRLKEYFSKLNRYADDRDNPSIEGTSRFSMFLKNGTLTVPQIIAHYKLQPYVKKASGRDTFMSELIWREFYYHFMFRHPRVETEAFLKKYEDLKWENNKEWFEAWKEGKTGFPIVDAGMRQLKTTGWMHNRVRMIVASFLTKDLLIDWRWGEAHFMHLLLDGV